MVYPYGSLFGLRPRSLDLGFRPPSSGQIYSICFDYGFPRLLPSLSKKYAPSTCNV